MKSREQTRTTDSESTTADALRTAMECVVLSARPDAKPSGRPPVEIYLGTEPAQYRANRVFGYSIEKARDPGREVRIHLMSELDGFDRRGWTTGFTNYRFAIPAFCGGRGRAIYNDEDEIYRTDPGRLFDLDLGGAGYLAISDTESSVMLIDCERMASVWTLEEAQLGWKRTLLRKASRATGHRGELDPGWNARDEEFIPDRSHLLHYTTLHTQPWRPFPERFVYQEGAYTQLWHDLEREAIAEGFELFHRAAPSKRFAELRARLERLPRGELPSAVGPSGEIARAVESLARQAKCRSWIELMPDLRGEAETRPGRFGLDAERRVGLLEWLVEGSEAGERFDGVVCADGLEGVPVWDIPWVIASLFERARGFVFVAVRCQDTPRRRFLHPPAGTAFTQDWWRSHFEAASVRHPDVRWELLTTRGRDFARDGHHLARGGPRLDATPPRIWILADGDGAGGAARDGALERPLRALADAIGGVVESAAPESAALTPAWPDLLIAAGRGAAKRARRIREEAHGHCLVVALGHAAGLPIDEVDLAVIPRADAIFPHPRLLEIERPLVAPPARGAHRASEASARIAAIPGPRLVVRLDAGTAEGSCFSLPTVVEVEDLARRVAASATALSASVLLSASSDFPSSLFDACRRALGEVAFAEPASADVWSALLAQGDLFVVEGTSDERLCEIVATGRPVFLARALEAPTVGGLVRRTRQRIAEAVIARARAKPANDRGTTRPQEGLEWLCAKLVADGSVRPRSDPDRFRASLLAAGHVRPFDAALTPADRNGFPPPPPSELERVAERVRAMLGLSSPSR